MRPPKRPGPQARTNLPSRLPWLYGRAEDLAAIAALLRVHPVVTITGTGGIGKTRVAQAVAKRLATQSAADYPDGVWWVELAAHRRRCARAAGGGTGHGCAARRRSSHRRSSCGRCSPPQRALLVLDNCEHLADAVAALVDTVTAGAPRVSILVTSQETLKAADEHVYRLGALAVSAAADTKTALHSGAVELFGARAQAVDPRFALTAANLPAVIEICRRLDGIPLAIELAAARLPLLGVEGLRARLHERFNLLTGGARVVLRRHQTLRATLEWSHALLTPDEQTVFRRLAVFAGGFTLEAAQHVASDERIDPWTALDHLGALVDKSLVLAEGDPIPRYRMLETTRAYALERLAEAGETQATLRRHAEAVLALLEPYEQDDWRWRATGICPAAKVELDNLRAALEWADAAADSRELVVALAGVSYSVWWSSSHAGGGPRALPRVAPARRRHDAHASRGAVLARDRQARPVFVPARKLRCRGARSRVVPRARRRSALLRRADLRRRAGSALRDRRPRWRPRSPRQRGSSVPSGRRASAPACNSPAVGGSRARAGSRRRSRARSDRWRSVATAASKSLRCTPCPTSRSWSCCSVAGTRRSSTRARPLPVSTRSAATPARATSIRAR